MVVVVVGVCTFSNVKYQLTCALESLLAVVREGGVVSINPIREHSGSSPQYSNFMISHVWDTSSKPSSLETWTGIPGQKGPTFSRKYATDSIARPLIGSVILLYNAEGKQNYFEKISTSRKKYHMVWVFNKSGKLNASSMVVIKKQNGDIVIKWWRRNKKAKIATPTLQLPLV